MKNLFASFSFCLLAVLLWPSFLLDNVLVAPPNNPFVRAYEFNVPNQTIELPDDLEEVSGLSLYQDGRQLVAVQDEDGIIYTLNRLTGLMESEVEFWKDGDYEGIEAVGDDIFILKSTGTLYQVQNVGKKNQQTIKFNAFLDKDNDAEGLAYDQQNHRLLIACKAKAGEGEQYEKKKGIYAFDLRTNSLRNDPVYVLGLKAVWAYLDQEPDIRKLEKIQKFFSPDDDDFSFGPSGLAIHPMTGELYIISSKGKLLLVMGTDGTVRHIEKLDKEIHPQPEGICFGKDGTLYIANEGKGEKPWVQKFDYLRP